MAKKFFFNFITTYLGKKCVLKEKCLPNKAFSSESFVI